MIIGDIEIADNCIIGAGAVITKSFTKPGTIIEEVPAKEINLERNRNGEEKITVCNSSA